MKKTSIFTNTISLKLKQEINLIVSDAINYQRRRRRMCSKMIISNRTLFPAARNVFGIGVGGIEILFIAMLRVESCGRFGSFVK